MGSIYDVIEKDRKQYERTKDKIPNIQLFTKYNLDNKTVYNPKEVDEKLKSFLFDLIERKLYLSSHLACDREMNVLIGVIEMFEKNFNIKLEE